MQRNHTNNQPDFTDISYAPQSGKFIAFDYGLARIGLATCDALHITVTPVRIIHRKKWTPLSQDILRIIDEFDARAIVIGLPLNTDGSESDMSVKAREFARKVNLLSDIPVFLQDERVTTYEARGNLFRAGYAPNEVKKFLDAEAAAIILEDFLGRIPRPTPEPMSEFDEPLY